LAKHVPSLSLPLFLGQFPLAALPARRIVNKLLNVIGTMMPAMTSFHIRFSYPMIDISGNYSVRNFWHIPCMEVRANSTLLFLQERNMRYNDFRSVIFSACILTLTACGTTMPGPQQAPATMAASGYGVVQSIDVAPSGHSGIGAGAALGAVAGGLLGNQIGGGSGRTVATVAGVAGGALTGNQMEKNMHSGQSSYRIAVRMDNGSVQTLSQSVQPSNLQVGDRVRLANGGIVEILR